MRVEDERIAAITALEAGAEDADAAIMPALVDMLLQIEHADPAALTPEIMQLFQVHPWPGNIRQLHNVIRTALALAAGEPIGQLHLTQDFLDDITRAAPAEANAASLGSLTQEVVRKALLAHAGNVAAAARQLGISRNTLYRKLKSLGLS